MDETRYTPEELMQMEPEALDELVEKLVLGGRPESETVRWIRDNWLERQRKRKVDVTVREEVPEYSSCHAGFCLIAEVMKRRGIRGRD